MTNKRYVIIGLCVLFLLWAGFTYSGAIKPILLPPPHKVLFALADGLLFTRTLIMPLCETVIIWLAAFIFSAGLGVLFGAIAGYYDKFYLSCETLVDFFRSLPSLLIIPLAIVFFGIGKISAFMVALWASFFYTFINTVYGVKYSKKNYLLVAKTLKMGHFDKFTKIIMPASLPNIFAGFRLSLSVSLIVTVGSEMILGLDGLGGKAFDAYRLYNITEIYVIIILVGFLGYISNKLLVLIEEKIIHWKGE